MVFKVLMIGHLLGDFYFQSDQLAVDKGKQIKSMFLHGLLYFTALSLVLIFAVDTDSYIKLLSGGAVVSLIHCLTDWTKVRLEKHIKNTVKYGAGIFLADQLIHIICLYLFYSFCGITAGDSSWMNWVRLSGFGLDASWIIAALICWKPASIFVMIIFRSIPNIVSQSELLAEGVVKECKNEGCPLRRIEAESAKVGSWIGILEREIILVLGILNQFSAIGFVLAAKSMARFKQLENKAFAEKYLVGTLLSTLISFLCIGLTRSW